MRGLACRAVAGLLTLTSVCGPVPARGPAGIRRKPAVSAAANELTDDEGWAIDPEDLATTHPYSPA